MEVKRISSLLKRGLRARRKLRGGVHRLWERARRRAAAPHAAAENVERAASIATRVTGLPQTDFAIRVSVLSSENRALVRLHEVLPAAQPESCRPLLRMIEKCSARPQEYHFYRLVAARTPAPERVPAPALYGAIDVGFKLSNHLRYAIYLEDVGLPALADRSPQRASALARSISLLSTLSLPSEFKVGRAIRLSAELLSNLLSRAERAGHTRHGPTAMKLEEMVVGWPNILTVRQLNLPAVPGHNDLHLDNVRLRLANGAKPEVVFIDWEAFAWNYLGADLHHFVREAMMQPERAPFFEVLRSHYVDEVSKNYSISMLQIDVAAHAYALTRAMSRVIRKGSRRELYLTFKLYDRLAVLLATL